MQKSLLLLSLALCVALAACGRSQPTRFYVLENAHDPVRADTLPARDLRVARVNVPEYLDRNGMVSRVPGGAELQVSQFHAWAEPLAVGVRRLLQEGLAAPLLAVGINVPAAGEELPAAYTLLVDILRLDGGFEAAAELEARWTLRSGDDILGRGAYADREPLQGASYAALAAAQSRLVQRMTAHLAERLPALLRKK